MLQFVLNFIIVFLTFIRKLSLSFKKNHLILDNISLDISKGQVIGLLGPNGAGKSSLMNLITGVLKPNYGNIIIDGKDVTKMKENSMVLYMFEELPS